MSNLGFRKTLKFFLGKVGSGSWRHVVVRAVCGAGVGCRCVAVLSEGHLLSLVSYCCYRVVVKKRAYLCRLAADR